MKNDLSPESEFKNHVYEYKEDYTDMQGTSVVPERFGACSTCEHFIYVMYEHGKEFGSCGCNDVMANLPTGRDKIVKCNCYIEKGRLSLTEMASMATYIESGRKRKVGFAPHEKEDI
jgi:ferredoxin-thioredoxin reductase catalytic subunit